MSEMVHKVTAFITRDRNGERELLVFQHPNAGIQLPAGTVERGEDIETAVLREAREETGIRIFTLASRLGGIENELQECECIITRTVQVHLEPDLTAMPYERTLGRGSTVHHHATQNGWSHISCIEYNRLPNPQSIRWKITGWVPNDAISHHKPRHFYHLTTPEKTLDQWSLKSDGDRIFKPFWTSLSPGPDLIPPQDGWLATVRDQLENTA